MICEGEPNCIWMSFMANSCCGLLYKRMLGKGSPFRFAEVSIILLKLYFEEFFESSKLLILIKRVNHRKYIFYFSQDRKP